MTFAGVVTRIGIAAALTVSGISHAYLYIHGSRHIPTIGTSFLAQASVSFAIAALILVGGPSWLRWAGAMVGGGSLGAFSFSRSVGLFGFTEEGWQPPPHAAVDVLVEVLTVGLWVVYLVERRRARG